MKSIQSSVFLSWLRDSYIKWSGLLLFGRLRFGLKTSGLMLSGLLLSGQLIAAPAQVQSETSTPTLPLLQIQPELYQGVGSIDQLTLAADFRQRRQLGWQIGWQIFGPAKQQQGFGFTVLHDFASVWQTWYSKDEIERLLQKISPSDEITEFGLTPEAALALIRTVARTKAPDFDPAPLSGGFQQFSPAAYNLDYALHILQNFRKIATCPVVTNELMDTLPVSLASHSNCLPEFPPHAVMMKLAWGEANNNGADGPYYEGPIKDLGETGMTNVLKHSSDWLDAGTYQLNQKNAYMLRTPDSQKYYVLKGFHIVTKELKDWVWISFTWQPEPEKGFGQDRPEYIRGAYRHYIMGITVHELEMDPTPGLGADGRPLFPNLSGAFKEFSNKGHTISWNSNPFIEGPDSTSNCISCHQGQFATGKFGPHLKRKHFPFDYTFGTQNPEALLMPRVSFRKAINQAARTVSPPVAATPAKAQHSRQFNSQ